MKPVWMICIVCAFAAAPALAQPATRPAQRPGGGRGDMLFQRVQGALDDLNLSDAQKGKIKDIFDTARQDLQNMAGDLRNMGQEERGQRVRQFMLSVRDKIQGELTDDQKQLFEEKVRQFRGAAPGNAPATQPGAGAPGGPAQSRAAAMLQQLEQSVQKLQLSDDQKTQIKSIVSDARDKLADLRAKSAGDLQQMRDGAREIFADTREKLSGLLTDDQREKLRGMMESAMQPGNGANAGDRPPRGRLDRGNEPKAPQMQEDKPADKPQPDAPKADDPKADATPPPGPGAGQAAPTFALQKLDGRSVQLSSFKGRILVLVFGSYSSPSFRQRAPQIQELMQSEGSRASFLIVYAKEAHPKDGWQVERNRDEKIALAQHTDMPSRIAQAKQMRETLKLTVPIAIDDMDNSVATSYGAGENTALLIGRDGTILSRQTWADPFALKRAIGQAATP